MNKLLKELQNWGIKPIYYFGRVYLEDGDKTARKHYADILDANPELEIDLILDMARHDKEVLQFIEERAAIREADGLPGDIESAVRCNFQLCPNRILEKEEKNEREK